MRPMADLAEIEKKQAEAAKFALKMAEEKDPKILLEMAAQLQARCQDLEKMARGLEAAFAPGGPTGPETTVVLTQAQRERVVEQTKVGVETVTLRDTRQDQWSRKMSKVEPREIERMAAQQAAQTRLVIETRTQVEKIIKELKKLNVPEIAGVIADLERDPTLGLAKKK